MTTAAAGAGTTEPATPTAEQIEATAAAKATADAATIAAAKKVTDDAAAAATATAAPKAPATYELKVSESGRAHVDDSDLTRLEKVARAADWTNEEAQAAIDEAIATSELLARTYMDTTKADPEFGGDKLAQTEQLAKSVIDLIRPDGHARRDGFLQFIARNGSGNNIHVVSFLADIGKRMAEDSPAFGRPGGTEEVSAQEKLYGKEKPAG